MSILNFDQYVYEDKIRKMEHDLGIVFDGNASVNTAKHIIGQMKESIK